MARRVEPIITRTLTSRWEKPAYAKLRIANKEKERRKKIASPRGGGGGGARSGYGANNKARGAGRLCRRHRRRETVKTAWRWRVKEWARGEERQLVRRVGATWKWPATFVIAGATWSGRDTRAARGRRIQARDRHPRSRLASIGFTPRSRNVYKYNAIRIRAQDPYEPRSSIRSTTVLEVDGFNWWPLRLNQCREWSPRLRKILVERDTRKEA